MRSKLQKFTEFANTLLPHETAYLLTVQQFDDKAKLSILQRMHENCSRVNAFTPYDETVDKRKYSNLKTWISERLIAIDVDQQFEWMSDMERQIMTDAIQPEEEKRLLKTIPNFPRYSFFFTKFYELVESYRHYLLIRMRYADHQLANEFLKTHRDNYLQSKAISEKIHEATMDIVDQYSHSSSESIQWEQWLTEVFYNEALDGLNRYLALVRLTFVYYNYRRLEPVLEKYDYLDGLFLQGIYYSKRLLINYYNNRLLLHSKFQEWDKAEYYGYLSIRTKNSDYLHYVNNLAAVLMREKKYKEALLVMKDAYTEAKETKSFHSKIGFVAFYIKCLNHNRQYRSAENYGESFLSVYRREIFEYRWHLFFSAYLDALLQQNKYDKLLKTVKKYQLLYHDRQYEKKATYLPTIRWYHAIAEYKESLLSFSELTAKLLQPIAPDVSEPDRLPQLLELLREVSSHIPEAYQAIQGKLFERGILQ
ncbi:MAG: hypothetical protein HUU01_04670 [Saprospiraceae bacterium]|nr:hypothetical protein [Saprospiraceae bacterium]